MQSQTKVMWFKVKRLFLCDYNCHFYIDFQCFLLANDMMHYNIASHGVNKFPSNTHISGRAHPFLAKSIQSNVSLFRLRCFSVSSTTFKPFVGWKLFAVFANRVPNAHREQHGESSESIKTRGVFNSHFELSLFWRDFPNFLFLHKIIGWTLILVCARLWIQFSVVFSRCSTNRFDSRSRSCALGQRCLQISQAVS